jgi:uncharacterized membrane protein YukC
METFKKRQKEMKRLEKQRDKAARRLQRKQEHANGTTTEAPLDEDPSAAAENSPDTAPPADS